MASRHDIIGEEWRTRATELADWASLRLVNRRDVWGQYALATPTEKRKSGRSYRALTLPAKDQRGDDKVTLDKLTRHFASRRLRKPQLIGLHAKSKNTTSRWLGIDVDCHDTEATGAAELGRRNLNAVVHWYEKLQLLGHDPLLFDSNGAGGYHVWVLFAEAAPTQQVFDFAQWLLADWEHLQLERLPETFPKQVKQDSIGSWFRLPGLHHTRDHYSSVWAGDEGLDEPWLTGHTAIDSMLACVPGPAPVIPTDDIAAVSRQSRQPRKTTAPIDAIPGESLPAKVCRYHKKGIPRVCVDLDGVLATRVAGSAIGSPVDGAIEFTRTLATKANIIIHTARFSTTTGKPRSAGAIEKLERRIENWLEVHGFAYSEINTNTAKPIALAYIDDRAVACQPLANGMGEFDAAIEAVEQLYNSHKG